MSVSKRSIPSKMRSRALALVAAACVAVLVLSGCGASARTFGPPPLDAGRTPTGGSSPHAGTGVAESSAGALPGAWALPAPVATLPPATRGARVSGPRPLPVPVLMYHHIGPQPALTGYPGLFVAVPDFVAQLEYLERQGYEAVTLRQVYDFWHGHGTLPAKPVVLSFDDGNRNDFAVVAPLLKSIGWPGVLNLIVGTKPRDFARMHFGEVSALVDAGWEIDAHTMTHPNLVHLDPSRLAWEVSASRAEIQKRLGVPCDFFCYPAGRFDARVIQAVQAAGYLGATTTMHGLASPTEPFTLRRIRVSGGESIAGFAQLLASAR